MSLPRTNTLPACVRRANAKMAKICSRHFTACLSASAVLICPLRLQLFLLPAKLKGYEGEGGLHALLHGRGWITSLSAGSMISASDFQLFRLTMSLTEAGERHSDEIIELCHRYLALLREDLPQKRIQVRLSDNIWFFSYSNLLLFEPEILEAYFFMA